MKNKNKICILILTGIYIFFISIYNVKAQVISQPWNFTINVPGRYGYQDYIFQGAPFYNVPQGKIIFTANFNSINNEYDITSISSVYLTSTNGNKFTCTLGNYDVNAGTYSTTTGNPNNYYQSISVECPIDFSNGDNLKAVMFVLNYAVEIDGTYRIKVSEFATYVSDSNSQIANNTNDIKNKMNEDISQSDKDAPDQTQYNNAKQQEENIIQSINNVSPNDITFSQDIQANNKIWDTTTRILQTHAKVMGLVISILSIGIIKLIMNR